MWCDSWLGNDSLPMFFQSFPSLLKWKNWVIPFDIPQPLEDHLSRIYTIPIQQSSGRLTWKHSSNGSLTLQSAWQKLGPEIQINHGPMMFGIICIFIVFRALRLSLCRGKHPQIYWAQSICENSPRRKIRLK